MILFSLLIALSGTVLSGILFSLHYGVGADSLHSFCSMASGAFDCQSVTESKYATVVGIPVSTLSLLYYISWLLFIPGNFRDRQRVFSVSFFLSLFSLVPTIVFFCISFFLLQQFCLYCSGLYLVSLISAVGFFILGRSGERLQSLKSGFLYWSSFYLGGLLLNRARKVQAALSLLFLFLACITLLSPSLITRIPSNAGHKYSHAVETQLVVEQWMRAVEHNIPVNIDPRSTKRDFFIGNASGSLEAVVFSDFECPHCRFAASMLEELVKDEPELRVVYKNFPLDIACNPIMKRALHEFACVSSKIAHCAGLYSKNLFWVAHDYIFEHQDSIEEAMDELPEVIEVPKEALSKCINSEDVKQKIAEDIQLGLELEIGGTPAIFVNGQLVATPTREALLAIISHAKGDS